MWEVIDNEEKDKIFQVSEEYKDFLDKGKTEREAAEEIIRLASKNGYIPIEEAIEKQIKLTPGMKIYANNKNKAVALFVLGKEKLEKGMHIIGSHLDAPKTRFKTIPTL